MRLKATAGTGLILIVVLFVLWLGGYRVNLTPSLAKGVYRQTAERVGRGDLVTFCLAVDNPYSALAKDRGYIAPGGCPSDLRPLLKHLAGLPGDHVAITDQGISINGSLLPGTVRLAADRQGRELPPSLLIAGEIPEGLVLVLSQEHRGSLDSRHFGLVPSHSLIKVRPILTFKQDTSVSEKGFSQ